MAGHGRLSGSRRVPARAQTVPPDPVSPASALSQFRMWEGISLPTPDGMPEDRRRPSGAAVLIPDAGGRRHRGFDRFRSRQQPGAGTGTRCRGGCRTAGPARSSAPRRRPGPAAGDLLGGQRGTAALVDAALLGQLDALPLPLADQGPLELSERPHDAVVAGVAMGESSPVNA